MRVIGYAAVVLISAVFFVPQSSATNCSSEHRFNNTIAKWRNETLQRVDGHIPDAQCISITICIQNDISSSAPNESVWDECTNTTFVFYTEVNNVTCIGTTAETTTLSTTTPMNLASKAAEDLDDISKKLLKNPNHVLVDENTTAAVLNSTTGLFGGDEENVSTSKDGESIVTGIKVPNGNWTALKAVVINQKLAVKKLEPTGKIPSNDPGTSTTTVQQVTGSLISVSIYDENSKELSASEVKFSINVPGADTAKLSKKAEAEAGNGSSVFGTFVAKTEFSCVFYDKNAAKWSTDGCVTKNSVGGKTSCSCNHTTVFAVMMSATVVTVPEGVQVLSYVVEVISIVFLLVTVFLLAKVRNRVRGDRVKVQICVAASLLCLHILNVFNNVALENNTACEIVTVLTHYFLLCSAFWMLMEGITLLFKTMDSVMRLLNGKNARKFAIARYVFSFTAPGIIVLISAAVGFSNHDVGYMATVGNNPEYVHCWVGNKILIGAVIIPVSISLLCCVLIVGRMFYIVYRMSSEGENFKPIDQRRATTSGEIAELWYIKAALKATLVLLPVLGVPWFLGFFTGIQNGEVRIAFMYVNAVVNGLQGVMLFFVYCVIGKEVRKAIMKSYSRKIYALSSTFEFTSKQRRMTNDHSTSAHPTLSTNVGENFSEPDRQSNASAEGSPTQTNKL